MICYISYVNQKAFEPLKCICYYCPGAQIIFANTVIKQMMWESLFGWSDFQKGVHIIFIRWKEDFSIFDFEFCESKVAKVCLVINPDSLFIAFFIVPKHNLLLAKEKFRQANLM